MNNFVVTFYFDLGVLDPEVESAPASDGDALKEHVLGVEIYNLGFENIFVDVCHVLRINDLGFVNIYVDICNVLGHL